jgi:hypothetical protein
MKTKEQPLYLFLTGGVGVGKYSKKENIFFPTIEISSIMTMDKFLYFT